MPKERQSNIELLRIVAMLLVLVIHANYWRIGVPTSVEAVSAPLPTFVRILIQHLAAPCVDVFIIISGYFAIRPKMKSLCNLWFLLAFWGAVSAVVDGGDVKSCILRICLPFLGWFIPAYLGLYLVSPLLNRYAENEGRAAFARYLLLFFSLQTVFDFLFKGWSIFGRTVFNQGYSVLSFAFLYLLGRYLRLHRPGWLKRSFTRWIGAYAGLFALSALFVFVLMRMGHGHCGWVAKILRHAIEDVHAYSSPVCILGSVFLFFAFDSLSFSSRAVNRIAASALGVFCFHSMGFYAPVVKRIYASQSGVMVLVLDALFIFGVYLLGCVIDQVRLWLWNIGSKHVFRE